MGIREQRQWEPEAVLAMDSGSQRLEIEALGARDRELRDTGSQDGRIIIYKWNYIEPKDKSQMKMN